MTEKTRGQQPVRLVMIGDQAYEKPFSPSCGACRSPYGTDIDQALSEGYSYALIRKLFAGRKPACPNGAILQAHVAQGHLAGPHMKARIAFEEAAASRGDSALTASAGAEDSLAALLRHGNAMLLSGMMEVKASDLVAAVRLQVQLDRARDGEGVEASAWQSAFLEFFEIVRRHLGQERWKSFAAEAYASPVIRAVLAREDRALPGGNDG